jgi:hypothetical protein
MKKATSRILRLALTAAIIVALVLFARKVNWHTTWRSIADANRRDLALAALVNLLSLALKGVRWWIFLRPVGSPSLWLAIKATFAGAGLNNILVASGGEAARVVFARIMAERANVLVLDEPTNHLDIESIEALTLGLKAYEGTLLFVSHDRAFVSSLATRIVEVTEDGFRDRPGTYAEYLASAGDDHLDVDTVVLKAKKDRRSVAPASSA